MNMLSSCTDCELSIAGSKMKALSNIVRTSAICQLLHLFVFFVVGNFKQLSLGTPHWKKIDFFRALPKLPPPP